MKKCAIYLLIFFTLICLYPLHAESSDPVNIPFGKNIMPNGRFADFEWDDAALISADGNFDILVKQDNTYLYFAIKFKDAMHTGVDLYFAESPLSRKMLHVSSALGERNFHDGNWLDWIWGENHLWTANAVGMIRKETGEQATLELDGFEFQIDKSMFQNKLWYYMIHLKRPEQTYPPDANPENIDNWLTIKL